MCAPGCAWRARCARCACISWSGFGRSGVQCRAGWVGRRECGNLVPALARNSWHHIGLSLACVGAQGCAGHSLLGGLTLQCASMTQPCQTQWGACCAERPLQSGLATPRCQAHLPLARAARLLPTFRWSRFSSSRRSCRLQSPTVFIHPLPCCPFARPLRSLAGRRRWRPPGWRAA